MRVFAHQLPDAAAPADDLKHFHTAVLRGRPLNIETTMITHTIF